MRVRHKWQVVQITDKIEKVIIWLDQGVKKSIIPRGPREVNDQADEWGKEQSWIWIIWIWSQTKIKSYPPSFQMTFDLLLILIEFQ